MALVRWAPRTEVESSTCDPFFRRFFDLLDDGERLRTSRGWFPAMDLVEERDRLVAELELPGIDPKKVQIQLQGDVLTVQGERRADVEESKSKVLKREQCFGTFQRTLQLPYRVQADQVKAQYKDGILSIFMPKAEEYIGRQIPVEVEK